MKNQPPESPCPAGPNHLFSGCRVESVVTVDDRGQMVLPKEVREKAGIGPGDKLALIAWEQAGRTCCITLIKTEELTGMVKAVLGPMMRDLMTD
ncbi:MAG: AbrB/MazE/SpoVT family DNA-binding domain-containing protein [Proteobacteria bacterium]|nr:AbrB/MazE/SpoVT family DNA-binding domain-containing protein [Pseudomonadota bacterium]